MESYTICFSVALPMTDMSKITVLSSVSFNKICNILGCCKNAISLSLFLVWPGYPVLWRWRRPISCRWQTLTIRRRFKQSGAPGPWLTQTLAFKNSWLNLTTRGIPKRCDNMINRACFAQQILVSKNEEDAWAIAFEERASNIVDLGWSIS